MGLFNTLFKRKRKEGNEIPQASETERVEEPFVEEIIPEEVIPEEEPEVIILSENSSSESEKNDAQEAERMEKLIPIIYAATKVFVNNIREGDKIYDISSEILHLERTRLSRFLPVGPAKKALRDVENHVIGVKFIELTLQCFSSMEDPEYSELSKHVIATTVALVREKMKEEGIDDDFIM